MVNPLYVVEPGYETPTGEWDEYSSYVNVEGLDINSPVCNINLSFKISSLKTFQIIHLLSDKN